MKRITVKIVEEVPGVPKDESYFVRTHGIESWRAASNGYVGTSYARGMLVLHFPSAAAGRAWARACGFIAEVEPFVP